MLPNIVADIPQYYGYLTDLLTTSCVLKTTFGAPLPLSPDLKLVFKVVAPLFRQEFREPGKLWWKASFGWWVVKQVVLFAVKHFVKEGLLNYFKEATRLGYIASHAAGHVTKNILDVVFDPVKGTVMDLQGHVLGYSDIYNDLPGGMVFATRNITSSLYDLFLIMTNSSSDYVYEVAGIESDDAYNFTVSLLDINGIELDFNAIEIPISIGETHKYIVNWTLLEIGMLGVEVYVDEDGDGTFEYTFLSDCELTSDEFEEATADNIAPTTLLVIGDPQYIDPSDNIYVTSDTPFTLTAEDNPEGSGVAFTGYRITPPHDNGWIGYAIPFYLTDLPDGVYNIEYNSTDNAGNVETTKSQTVILDNTNPSISVSNPPADWALQDGVAFTGSIVDSGSGVTSMCFSLRKANGGEGTPVGFECLSVSYDPITGEWSFSFDTLLVPDGYYVLYIEAEDNLGNEASTTVPYSIRNWAVIELLPSSEDNKAGRTMPVKFALRVAAEVDPDQPFVYNEELRIEIFTTDNPDDVLQESYYGDTAGDYRVSSVLYITNFKTMKRKPVEYTVAIYRDTFDVGSFTFETIK